MTNTEISPEKVALERINLAINTKVTSDTLLDTFLDLSNLGLLTIPAEIEKLTQYLKGLSLSNNPQMNFSEEIKKLATLENLIELSLSNNSLETLPAEIGLLNNLTRLDLSINNLKTLPTEIESLQNLTRLDIWDNNFEILPKEIAQLEKLETLYAYDNYLTSIPREIGQLINLKNLSFLGNQITTIPNTIANLLKLETLDLRDNALMIPLEILDKITAPKTILHFYYDLVKKQRKPLNETKIVLVGQGSVGKLLSFSKSFKARLIRTKQKQMEYPLISGK